VEPRPFPSPDRLRAALAGRPHPPLDGSAWQSAVAICLHRDSVLLAQRAVREGDPWSGDVGLPGGRFEPDDDDLLATALRETREEVGFDPLEHGALLGALGSYTGLGRRIAGVRIAAFVLALDSAPPLVVSDELESAWWVPLAHLRPEPTPMPAAGRVMPAYRIRAGDRERVVWGITLNILELLRAEG
jgi:8-oxo-dGTP pyrophosphatase MutT (NUDIX family)